MTSPAPLPPSLGRIAVGVVLFVLAPAAALWAVREARRLEVRPAPAVLLNGATLPGGGSAPASTADLDLAAMFPAKGDARAAGGPGQELELPHPPGGRRIFSLAEDGRPYQLEIFSAPALDPEASAEQHRRALRAAGFTVSERPALPDGARRRASYFAQRPELSLVVVALPDDDGGTTTTIMATRNDRIVAGDSR